MTISRPGVMVSRRCELGSASTKTEVLRSTVAIRPEGGFVVFSALVKIIHQLFASFDRLHYIQQVILFKSFAHEQAVIRVVDI